MTHDTGPDETSTDPDSIEALEARLAERREPYARATVVRREPPVSANVGDRGIVTADGELHGWIGGAACAQSTVADVAVSALEDDEPRLVGLSPDPAAVDRPGIEAHPMTCHSEGTLEVFVEPVVPTRELLIVGDSPTARALARLASELTLDVSIVAPEADENLGSSASVISTTDPEEIGSRVGTAPFVVVASMGEFDARGVAAGVHTEAPYLGLIASDARAAEVIERAAGLLSVDPETVSAAVTNPAGVDVAAYTPSEIAVSVLAEVVDATNRTSTPVEKHRSSKREESADEDAGDTEAESVIDPVCGMSVDPETSVSVDHDGETVYFCCHGCADTFRNDPEAYTEPTTGPA
ncbi:MAG: XdhC family protein [Natronomonas sp.]